ncbi:SDR family NAD(P)-dependent oxidoreductase [Microlunatus soli]|uniref:Short-chain dehydrogenase n=1 Tax=Microlunatus soli TaxID=630515 RepID=A0A1H1MWG1_9ACTN|nr:SDR family NAD(P)-dependent oxidoreductase [Microlunatus soli]SDR91064.1 Short-chain dehydrogenase [Microlunatus soli]
MKFVITGVRRGIGRLVAERLIADGHQVYGVLRPGSTADDLDLAGSVHADLAEPGSLPAATSDLTRSIDRLDGLVHSAGIIGRTLLAENSPADMQAIFDVNVLAGAELVRCLLPQLRHAAGTVVLVNSTSGLSAGPPLSAYGTSKYALRGYAEALRAEEPRLRVTSIFPSRTATDMQRELRAIEQGEFVAEDYLRPSTVADLIIQALLLPDDAVLTDVVVRPRARPRS